MANSDGQKEGLLNTATVGIHCNTFTQLTNGIFGFPDHVFPFLALNCCAHCTLEAHRNFASPLYFRTRDCCIFKDELKFGLPNPERVIFAHQKFSNSSKQEGSPSFPSFSLSTRPVKIGHFVSFLESCHQLVFVSFSHPCTL